MCVFKGVLCVAFGTRFQSFWSRSFTRKDISCRVRNQMLDKIVFRQALVCFFFFSMFLWHYFIYVPLDFVKVLIALILGGTSKSRVFEKMYTKSSVLSIRTPGKDAGFI